MRTQYQELCEYWRHFNSIIWAIPSVAVAIMAGIIVGSFQNGIVGWPRFAALVIGSIFLLALAIELSRKILHMEALSYLLKNLQENLLKCDDYDDYRFPLGYSKDIEIYRNKEKCKEILESKRRQEEIDKKYCECEEKRKKNKDKLISNDLIFKFLARFYARKSLLYVTFSGFIAILILAIFVFLDLTDNYTHLNLPIHLAYNLTRIGGYESQVSSSNALKNH